MNATLHNGDAMQVMALIPKNSVDLVLTDPPFRVISGGKNDGKVGRPTGILAKNDGKIFKHNNIKPSEYLPELFRVLKPGRDAYVMVNNLTLREMLNAADDAGFAFHGLLSWDKNTCTPSRWYMKDREWIVYLYKAPARPINNPSSKQGFACDNPRGKSHPTEKPVELMAHYVTNSTKRGQTVFDPFMGSGSTGIAALANGRKFIGIEIDPDYFTVAEKRINEPIAANDNKQLDIEEAIRQVA